MVNISNLRFVSLEPSGDVTVSRNEQPDAVSQMLVDARWLPQVQEEIPYLEKAAKRSIQEFQLRFRNLMATCEGF